MVSAATWAAGSVLVLSAVLGAELLFFTATGADVEVRCWLGSFVTSGRRAFFLETDKKELSFRPALRMLRFFLARGGSDCVRSRIPT